MRVLVTGSAGFVASHIVEHIMANTDWKVIGLDSFRHRGDAQRVNHIDPERYEIVTCDLSAPISIRTQAQLGRIDYIINAASESHVERSITEPGHFIQNNTNLALYMAELCRDVKPKAFIQVSTDEVYGAAPEGMDHKEWSPIIPSNPYSASKACQEAVMISYWRTYNIPLIIVNAMNMFGERQDVEKYIPTIIRSVTEGREVTVHGSTQYIGKRHYLHARNFADACLFLLMQTKPTQYKDHPTDIIVPDRYNVVGDVERDNLQLAQDIARILRKDLKFKLMDFHHARPGHDRRYSLDGSKIRKLGWKAPISYEDSLQKAIEWTMEHREWLKEYVR